MTTGVGGTRIVDMLTGEQLPRILLILMMFADLVR